MTIFGSDVSHYDSSDSRTMFSDGIVFQTHKAGGDATDNELAAWWSYVKSYRPGVLLGAYWVLYPGSPMTRADAFIARLNGACPGWKDGPFILQVDCEKWNGNADTVPSVSDINTFCDRLVQQMPKLNPIVYAPKWVYGDKVSGLRYPIWASAYVNGAGRYRDLYPGDGAKQWNAYGGRGPSILQFSSTATIGGQTTSDVNAFRGTLDQMVALLAPGWKKAEEPEMELTDKTGDGTYPNRTVADFFGDFWKLRDPLTGDAKAKALSPNSPIGQLLALPAKIDALTSAVAGVPAEVLEALGKDDLNEAAAALRSVFGDERAAALGALLSTPAS